MLSTCCSLPVLSCSLCVQPSQCYSAACPADPVLGVSPFLWWHWPYLTERRGNADSCCLSSLSFHAAGQYLRDWSMLIGCSQFIWCFLMGLISKVGKVLAAQELTEGESNSICKLINSNVPFPVLCYIFLLPSHLWIFTWSIKIRNKIKAKCLKGIGFVCDRAYAWIFSLIITLGGFMCLRLCLSFPPPV